MCKCFHFSVNFCILPVSSLAEREKRGVVWKRLSWSKKPTDNTRQLFLLGVIRGDFGQGTCGTLAEPLDQVALPSYRCRLKIERVETENASGICLLSFPATNEKIQSKNKIKKKHKRSPVQIAPKVKQQSELNVPPPTPKKSFSEFDETTKYKIAPWSSRWFEEISIALIWLALIWLALIWVAFLSKFLLFSLNIHNLGTHLAHT